MSSSGRSSLPLSSKHFPASPPVPPSVLLKAYTSSLSERHSTSSVGPATAAGPSSSSREQGSFDEHGVLQRPRRASEPSQPQPSSANSQIPTRPLRVIKKPSHRRPRPINTGPRPASASYAPRQSSPLCASYPEPDSHVPIPVVLAHSPPSPVPNETVVTAPLSPPIPWGGRIEVSEDILQAAVPAKRRVSSKDTRHSSTPSKRLSFAGLSSLFSSKKEGQATPNTLILQNRYCEQYIPPILDGTRFRKRPLIHAT